MRLRGGVILATVIALTTPALARPEVRWGGATFDDYGSLCSWLTARGARCDAWILQHASAWQSFQSAPPKRHVVAPAVAERDPATTRWFDSGLLALAAALLAVSIVPAPVAVRAWAGPRLQDGRVTVGAVGSTLLVTAVLLRLLA